MSDFVEIRDSLQFKYYGFAGSEPYIMAIYKPNGSEQSYHVLVTLPKETAEILDQRILESLLAFKAYQLDNPIDDKPAEVVKSSPRKVSRDSDSASVVVSAKTPQQIEKEAEEETDRIAGI